MKSLAMHITNQKWSFDIYCKKFILTHTMYFWLLLQTGFVVQGHISGNTNREHCYIENMTILFVSNDTRTFHSDGSDTFIDINTYLWEMN